MAEIRDAEVCEILKKSDADYRSSYPERKIAFRDAKFEKIAGMPGFLSEKVVEIADLISAAEHPASHVTSPITAADGSITLGSPFLEEYRSRGALAIKAFDLVTKTCKKLGVAGLSTPYIDGFSSH